MRIYLTNLLLYLSLILPAQNHDFFWVTDIDDQAAGPNEGNILNFSTYPPTISSDVLNIPTYVTLASMCDEEGNLIFYSNGIHVMNADYELMENGNDIVTGDMADDFENIGYPGEESIFVLPKPESPNLYYLIYNKIFSNPLEKTPQLFYSLIDMNLANGKGAIIEKEQFIAESTDFDQATASKHANGRDWWVIVPHTHDTGYFTFLLTPEGIVDTFTQYMTYYKPPYPDSINNFTFDRGGMNNFSPDGKIYVDYDSFMGIRIFDFDRCTGSLSDPPTVIPFIPEAPTLTTHGRAANISLNSRFLYISHGIFDTTNMLVQYDLWVDDIASSADTIALFDGFSDPYPVYFDVSQMMPDGRIYIAGYGYTRHLHYIQQPNLKGAACGVVQHGIELPNYYNYSKPHFPTYRLGPLDGSSCDTLGLNNLPVAKYRYDQDSLNQLKCYFTDLSYYEPANWSWNFGDNNTSTDTCPSHTFAAPGIYEVCLTVSNNNLPQGHTFCQTLNLGTSNTGETSIFKINLFPNPFHETTTLFLYDYLPQNAYILLHDATGREVHQQKVISGGNILELKHLPKGLYWYSIKEKEEVVQSGKLVKQ